MAENFDVVVIGGGPGGYIAAFRAGQLGFRTALVETRKSLGGTCLNVGCIPSKALLQSSELYAQAKHKLAKHGVGVGDITLDLAAMMKRKEAVVRQLTLGVASLCKKNQVEWIQGFGTITAPGQVVVATEAGKRELAARHIIIATGSEPTPLPSLPFDGKHIVSSTEALEFKAVPKRLLVVGGGVIGVELGSVWSRLGAQVTIVEYLDHILGNTDREVAGEAKKILAKQGLEFKLSTKVVGAEMVSEVVRLQIEDAKGNRDQLEGDVVLVAIGRRPFTRGLGIENLGVAVDKAGRIEVDAHFHTNVAGIYAIGDVIKGPMLAHKAEEEGVACVERIAGQAGHVNYQAIPSIVYTWPEVATVGLSEEECKARGIAYKTGKVPFMANGRAKCADDVDGFVKVIADARTDKLLGVHIIGPQASELIAEAVAVIEFGGSAEDIGRIVHAHPTLSETLKEAALAVDKRSLNF